MRIQTSVKKDVLWNLDISKMRFKKEPAMQSSHSPCIHGFEEDLFFHLGFAPWPIISFCGFSKGFRERRMRKMGAVQGHRGFCLITCYHKLSSLLETRLQSFLVVLPISMFPFFVEITFFTSRNGEIPSAPLQIGMAM